MTPAVRWELRPDGLGVLTIDQAETRANVLTPALWHDLSAGIATAAASGCRAVILVSGKPGMFIAGADLKTLGQPADEPRTRQLVQLGLDTLAAMEALPMPCVAAIEGSALGGGLEVALACDARIVSVQPRTELGLPEVKLGLIPGWGGTQRLPRIIDPLRAAELIATGSRVTPTQAVEIGLAARAVESAGLLEEALRLAQELADTNAWRSLRQQKQTPVRGDLKAIDTLRQRVRARTRGHLPAPLAALNVIEQGLPLPLVEALALESEAFVSLVGSPISRNLIAVFFQTQKLQKPDAAPGPTLERVAVVGAGVMGAGIAELLARQGVRVSVTDSDPAALARLPTEIPRAESPAALDDPQLIIEAVREEEAIKRPLFAQLAACWPNALLATNTSTLSVARLAEGLPHPERVAGLHFFNPVSRMELVEVVRGPATSDATVTALAALARRLGKTPILVRDRPGFLVNRVLFPYLGEALMVLDEGIDPVPIDAAAVQFGLPMGPITLCDVIGLDVTAACLDRLNEAFPERRRDSRCLNRLRQSGWLGAKTEGGFYRQGRPNAELLKELGLSAWATMDESLLIDRLILPMLAEGVRVLEEGVVSDANILDVGLILGMGFPSFRGGLLRWADAEGPGRLAERLARLERLYGARFAVPDRLATGRPFHSA